MKNKRRMMALDLTALSARAEGAKEVRRLVPEDAPALAKLMFDAYLGTIDDEGQPLEGAVAEVARTFAGDYGAMIWAASFVASSSAASPLASASVVTLWRDVPLLAFSMTAPASKRSGWAGRLIMASALALREIRYNEVVLVVTCGNDAAERLYEKLGFREIPPR